MTTSSARDRLIFAMDVPTFKDAVDLAETLREDVGVFKIGLELFMADGPQILRYFAPFPIMLDLKLHDIPETVERAVNVAGDLGVKFLTLHVQQAVTLRRAARAAEKTGVQLLAVTVLTSMTPTDVAEVAGIPDTGEWISNIDHVVKNRANLAWEAGITSFVCSTLAVGALRKQLGPTATIVVPGIRPAGVEANDQFQVGTPADAIEQGASYLVVGRPIRDAKDQAGAARGIVSEISRAAAL
jgi:orotidine-5'-phosphate decarboxylase